MNKRIILIHRWSGTPQSDWYPWLKKQLENRGYTVIVPEMPDTDNPQIKPWVSTLKNIVGDVHESDIFIGHSVGCQTILRFLEQIPDDKPVNKAIFVAPWFPLTNLTSPQAEAIAKPWIETPVDFAKVKQKANTFISLFSTNDPHVPYEENSALFKKRLDSKILTEKNKGHFTQDNKVTELPELLNIFRELG